MSAIPKYLDHNRQAEPLDVLNCFRSMPAIAQALR
jgi:hypothetical protein